MTRTWWDAEALVELVLGTEAAPAELRPPARHAWELAGALQVRTQRVVSGMDGLLTVAQMLGLRVAHLR